MKRQMQVRASDAGLLDRSVHTSKTLQQAVKIIANALIAIFVSLFALRLIVQQNNLWPGILAVPIALIFWSALVRNFANYTISLFEVTPSVLRVCRPGPRLSRTETICPWTDVAFFDDPAAGAQVMLSGRLITIPKSVTKYDWLIAAIRERARGLVGNVAQTAFSRFQLNEDALNKVVWLIQHDLKINAIKLYRDTTGIGLKESKDAVEEMEREVRAGTLRLTSPASLPATKPYSAADPPAKPPSLTDENMAIVCEHIRQGLKINAIKHYRLATGVGLKDAKDAVEQIERDMLGSVAPYAAPPAMSQPAELRDDILHEIRELVMLHRDIEAVKAYRKATGVGLREAKDYVDRLRETM